MKNFISLLIITFSLLILSNEESDAQCTSCPAGSTPTSFPITLATGCVAYVHYCFDCAPSGHPIAKICMVSIPRVSACSGILIDSQFWIDIRREMMKDLVTICSNAWGSVPPCSTSTRYSLEIVSTECMEVIDHPTDPGLLVLKPCDLEPGFCSKEYEVCWENGVWNETIKSVNFEPGECDYLPFELNPWSLPSWCTSIGCE